MRIEHAMASHYFPLGTHDEAGAAAKARDIYLAVVREGWERVNQRFARELTVAIHWTENPLAWTYATFHTQVEGPFPGAPTVSKNACRRVRVAIVDRDAGALRALADCTNRQTGFICAKWFVGAKEILDEIPRRTFDLALVNGSSSDATPAEFSNVLRRLKPVLPVLFFSTHEDSDQLFRATPGGASGYLLKRTPSERLFDPIADAWKDGDLSVDRIASLVRHYFQNVVESLSTHEAAREMGKLTRREHDILSLLSKGHLDKEIAEALGISLWTVHGHLKKIYEKLGVHTRTEAAIKYLHK